MSQKMIQKEKAEVIKVEETKYVVASDTVAGAYYVVNMEDDGPKSCSCQDYKHRGIQINNPGHVCKHMKRVIEFEVNEQQENNNKPSKKKGLSYKDDQYDF